MAYDKELNKALELASAAGNTIRSMYLGKPLAHSMKENNTPVTEADLRSNDIIIAGLRRHFPSDGIVSEETGAFPGSSGRTWYIDPIDGTKSYINRCDTFAVHVGLVDGTSPVMGVVYKPLTCEAYYGIVGEGAFRQALQSGPMRLSVASDERRVVPVAGSKRAEHSMIEPVLDHFGIEELIFSGSEGLRIMKIAEGLADLRIGSKMSNTWDLCAPHAILLAAGGHSEYLRSQDKIRYHGQGRMSDQMVHASRLDLIDTVRQVLIENERKELYGVQEIR